MLPIVLPFGFVLLLTAIVTDGQQFRVDYTYYPEANGWFKLHRVPANWHEARLRCDLEGAVLASPLNANLLNVLKDVMTNQVHCGIFSGIHATLSKGVYFSIEGVPLYNISVSWAPNEPNNYEDCEDCLMLFANGAMADVKCKEVFPYVCYKKHTNMFVSSCGTVDNEYQLDPRTGSCYKFHRRTQTWPRAFMTCAAEGGHLVIINSKVESQVVSEIYSKYPETVILKSKYPDTAFIGFQDWGVRGLWRTIHGQSLEAAGFENWGVGEPDNATTGEFCGSVFRTGYFNDAWCHVHLPFICEKNTKSLND